MGLIISDNQKLIDQQIQSERESDFDSNSAYGEIVDNALQANAKNIKIHFSSNLIKKTEILDFIAFGDDGDGMNSEIIEKCLSTGFSTRYNERDGIGRFGVGMTKGFLNQCLICEIYSKEKNSDWYYTKVDISPKNKKKNEIPPATKKIPSKDLLKLSGKVSGTIVIWSEHDKQDDKPSNIIENFVIWCGRTYREFIYKGIKIEINNNKVKTIDPTFLNIKNSKFPGDKTGKLIQKVSIPWPVDAEKKKRNNHKENITVKITLAPVSLREGRGDLKIDFGAKFRKLAQERYIDEDWQGISILRNDREVFFGIPFPWAGGIKFSEPRSRYVGFEISFNAQHDKSFRVKNIKRGAIPILELKKAINAAAHHLYRNACEQVTDQWNKYGAEQIIEKKKSGLSTGHEEAEHIAKIQTKTKDTLTQGKDPDELIKNAANLLDEKQKQVRAKWEAKFKSQPYVIMDSEWKGNEFVQIGYTEKGAVMKYNLSHPLHQEITKISTAMENEDDPEKLKQNAKKLKVLNDLLILTYCRAEKQKEPEIEVSNTEDFLEDLRSDWGMFLKRHLRDADD